MAYKKRARPKTRSLLSKLSPIWIFFLFIPGGVIAFAILYIIYIAWSIYYFATQGQSIPGYGNFAIFLLFIPLGVLLTTIATTILVFKNLKKFKLKSKLGILLINFVLLISPFVLLFVTLEFKDQERQRKTEEYKNMIKVEDIKYQELDKNEDGKLDTIGLDLTIFLNDDKPIENVLISANTSCFELNDSNPRRITNATSYKLNDSTIILEPGMHTYSRELKFIEAETKNWQNFAYADPPSLSINIAIKNTNVTNPILSQNINTDINPILYERKYQGDVSSCSSKVVK